MSKPTRKQKLIRKEFPKVRQLRRRGNTYYAVDLRRKFWIGPKWKYFTTRDDALKYLKQFFNWCVPNKHLRENPADGIQIEVDRGAPGFFTVEQCP